MSVHRRTLVEGPSIPIYNIYTRGDKQISIINSDEAWITEMGRQILKKILLSLLIYKEYKI